MTSLTIHFNDSTKLQKVLNFLKRLQQPFQIVEPETEEHLAWEPHIHAIIQDRLIKKYTKEEWGKMNDDERQDASLLERMLYDEEQPDYKVYSVEESNKILLDLKKELYARSTD